jgi:hypothetical protein
MVADIEGLKVTGQVPRLSTPGQGELDLAWLRLLALTYGHTHKDAPSPDATVNIRLRREMRGALASTMFDEVPRQLPKRSAGWAHEPRRREIGQI